jgi:hypothetical protein
MKNRETPLQFAARVAEFENDENDKRGEIKQPDHITWQLITQGENQRAREIRLECKAGAVLAEV